MKPFRKLAWANYAALSHGTKMPIEELDRFREDERQLLEANSVIMRVLEAAGIPCRRPDGDRVVSIHSITDRVTELDQLRNFNILPAVQVRKRRSDVVALEAYCAQQRWGLRMRLITSGVRCPVEDIAARIDFLHETIRRLPQRQWFSQVAELISCGIEFTTTPTPEGPLLYHLHAHLIYRILAPIPKDDFRRFIGRWKKHFRGRHCPDSGRIRDIREACKYPVKAADLLGIVRAGELPALFAQLRGRKMYQTYGDLRRLCGDLHQTGEKIKRRRLTHRDPEAVTYPQKPLIEYVRVGVQPTTRVQYGRRPDQDDRPSNIFLGRSHPFPDQQSGELAVQEIWLNPTLPPEELRRLRNIKRWVAPQWRQLQEEPALNVHTDIFNDRISDPKDAFDPHEVSPFSGSQEPDHEGDCPIPEPDFILDIPTQDSEANEVFSPFCSSPS